jgi:hypothetical protein
LFYQSYFAKHPRGVINILLCFTSNGIHNGMPEDAVNKLSRLCSGDISAEKVLVLLGNQPDAMTSSPPQVKNRLNEDLSLRQLQDNNNPFNYFY